MPVDYTPVKYVKKPAGPAGHGGLHDLPDRRSGPGPGAGQTTEGEIEWISATFWWSRMTPISTSCSAASWRGGLCLPPGLSGSEAALWAGQYEYDLVLLDLMLPGLTGEEFIAEMRQKKTMPIIVLSAKAGLEDRVNDAPAGGGRLHPQALRQRGRCWPGWKPSSGATSSSPAGAGAPCSPMET